MVLLPIRVDEFLDSLLSGWVSVLYGADIQFAQHGEVDAMLNLGTERMSRAFGNILKNAIDAVETSGVKQIDLFISDEGDSVNFLFKDSGVGIPFEIMSEIFLPFKTGNDLSGGPGLGLTIAKSIIESHGGKIWCVSEQGEGSEFYCALPKSELNDGEDDLLL